jgi:predicted glycosyltransferase
LAGELSHPKKLPGNIKYIGALSRFEQLVYPEKKYDLLVSISGPEPQRTVFENKILNELESYNGKVLLVRGLPGNENLLQYPSIEIKDHLTAAQLNEAILRSDIILARCGYTTIMDLVKLFKKAILIPTPGQTEQEYLAKHLLDKKIFYTVEQANFSLQKDIQEATSLPLTIPEYDMEQYKKVIDQFVQSL